MSAEPYVGDVSLFAFNKSPKDWLPCDGKVLNISDDHVLAAVIGWMAVIGLFYVGRVASNYIEASRSGSSLNQVAPASGPTTPQRP